MDVELKNLLKRDVITKHWSRVLEKLGGKIGAAWLRLEPGTAPPLLQGECATAAHSLNDGYLQSMLSTAVAIYLEFCLQQVTESVKTSFCYIYHEQYMYKQKSVLIVPVTVTFL